MKINWEKTSGAPEVLARHVAGDLNKFIVFCKDKEHLNVMEEEVRTWFRKAIGKKRQSYRVISGDADSAENLNAFRNAKDKNTVHLLLCIDMLNEGIHIDDVCGVILLRPTQSPIVFYQQIGRCIQVGMRHVPIVFDFVNNFRSVRATNFLAALDEGRLEERCRRASLGLAEHCPSIEIVDETKDVVALFAEIEERLSWKAEKLARTEDFCNRYKSLDNLPKQNSEDAVDRETRRG